MSNRVAGEIILDGRDGGIYIDGHALGIYTTEEGPGVRSSDPAGTLFFVDLSLMADRVVTISRTGEVKTDETPHAPDPHEDDLAWARVEARRIVREGLKGWL